MIWPKLRERAATREVDITRMEDTHRDIADDIARVRKIASSCADSADPRRASNSWASSSNSRPGWRSTSRTKSAASFRSSTPNSHPTNGKDNHRDASRGVAKGDTAHAVTGSSPLAPLVYRFDRVQVGFELEARAAALVMCALAVGSAVIALNASALFHCA